MIGAWAVVSLARLTRLVEPAEPPPGSELGPLLDFLRAEIPLADGYLFVLPGEFGTDTGVGKRLRYELYPRPYDDVRASQDEASIRQLMANEGLRFIVVAPQPYGYASHAIGCGASILTLSATYSRWWPDQPWICSG